MKQIKETANGACSRLNLGMQLDCVTPQRRYLQKLVLINLEDIDKNNSVLNNSIGDEECAHNVNFVLYEGKTGYLFTMPANGSSISGTFSKSTNDFGFPQYSHLVNMLMVGASEEAKCILKSLDKSSVVAVLKFSDGSYEVYGYENGLSTADYTYDLQGGGGGVAMQLQSLEVSPENTVPFLYKSTVEGGEDADFEDLFANASTTPPPSGGGDKVKTDKVA